MIYHPSHLTDEKTKAQRSLSGRLSTQGHATSGEIPPGTGKPLSTELAHSIFADVYFPEKVWG